MKREIQLHTKSGKKLINKSNKLPQYNHPVEVRLKKIKNELNSSQFSNDLSKQDKFDLIWSRITSEVKQKEYKHVQYAE